MKTKTIYTFILLLSVLSLFTNAQSYTEKLRADFLTKYYNKYQNELNLDSSQTSASDSLVNKNMLTRTDRIDNNKVSSKQSVNLDNLRANFLSALNSENKGVVESAIYVSIQFKNKFPNENVSTLVEALERIIKESDNERIRYKAQLAIMYINNSDWFKDLEVDSIKYEKEVYLSIAQTLSGKLFSQAF